MAITVLSLSHHMMTCEESAQAPFDHRGDPLSTPWTVKNIPSQIGKRVLVTGATSGIGWNTARELARAGAEVTIPARAQAKREDAAARIRGQAPKAAVRVGVMDLSSLASVRKFAEQQLEDPRPIDILVNNAGVMAIPTRTLSVDGFERQFATNVLGHFSLTGLLLPSILRARSARVVTVASYAHANGGPVPIPDLNSEKEYKPVKAYSKTKLANVLLFSVLCFVAPERLFGVDAYRTLTGVPIALLGAVTFGLAVSALVAARRGNIHVMRSTAMNMFLAAALVPPVITYNIGAFDAISTSGVGALSLSVTFIAGVSLPLLLSLLVLNRFATTRLE
jgi:NAD(P)-dependent dehydrogenase (short-subunit alcohol dehydrogenase family)